MRELFSAILEGLFGLTRRTPVLIDLNYLASRQAESLQRLTKQDVLKDPLASSLQSYLKNRKARPRAKLIVSKNIEEGKGQPLSSYTIDLSPALALTVEPFPERCLAVSQSIDLPEQNRAVYQAQIGSAEFWDIEDLVSWHVNTSKWPLATNCHVCKGSGRVSCSRCRGRGWYRSKSGKRRRCGADRCRGGKVPCYYCKGDRLLNCAIIRQNNHLWVKVPKVLVHDRAIALFLGKKRIRTGESPLFTNVINEEATTHADSMALDRLGRAERRFAEHLEEMKEFLHVELQSTVEEIESLKVGQGKIVDREVGVHTVIDYTTETDKHLEWSSGTDLALLEDPRSERIRVALHRAEPGHVQVRVKEKKGEVISVPDAGILITREGLRTVRVQEKALEYWKRTETLRSPLKSAFCEPEYLESGQASQVKKFFEPLIQNNPAQKNAVRKACSGSHAVLCIQGPPGTGKTSVICEIVRQILARKSGTILVSSQSNLAVDNVLERLMEVPKLRLLRLGRKERVLESVHPILLEESMGRNQENMPLPQVIGATCIGCDHPFIRRLQERKEYQKEKIRLAIIDEVGRSTPMETLVPMQFAERVILVGDHKQLPPTITSEMRETWHRLHPDRDIEESIGAKSLFEYWIKRLPRDCVCVLNEQFRMHSQIGSFIAEVFYAEEGLRNGVDDGARALPLPRFPEALSYHSTRGYGKQRFEQSPKKTRSRINPAEADLVVKLLGYLNDHTTQEKISVGVITLYKAQAQLIRKQVSQGSLSGLELDPSDGISTLDSFQGKEKDVIILSLVRCPADVKHFDAGWYKFFLDVRRLNVALSRAKRRLLIVGDLERILQVEKNRDSIAGFQILERLQSYVEEHQLEVSLP